LKLGHEFSFVAACCHWPPSEARCAAVKAAAELEIDWPLLLSIARRQRVEGLVSDAMSRCGIGAPAAVLAELSDASKHIAGENLAFAAESVRLQRLLDQAGIGFLFVKGVTLAMLAYGTLAVKKAWDIDMVVPPESILDACGLVAAAGYVRVLPDPKIGDEQFRTWILLSKDSLWQHPRTGIALEVHGRLVNNAMMLPTTSARSPRNLVTVAPGVELPTLEKEELFSYLCVHGASHAWSRLKWIADVAALLGTGDVGETERLYRESLRFGAGRCSAQALLLCARLFGTPLPEALKRELEGDFGNRLLVRVALGAMAGRHQAVELDDRVLGTVAIQVSHFLLRPGWRYKASELRRKLSNRYDRTAIPLPRSLHFLYPIILIPRWMWRRISTAMVRS
jgi:hypothetical protein